MGSVGELDNPSIFGSTMTNEQLDSLRFELYVNGYKASQLLSGNDFLNWLNLHDIDCHSYTIEQAKKGIEIELPDSIARWVSVK